MADDKSTLVRGRSYNSRLVNSSRAEVIKMVVGSSRKWTSLIFLLSCVLDAIVWSFMDLLLLRIWRSGSLSVFDVTPVKISQTRVGKSYSKIMNPARPSLRGYWIGSLNRYRWVLHRNSTRHFWRNWCYVGPGFYMAIQGRYLDRNHGITTIYGLLEKGKEYSSFKASVDLTGRPKTFLQIIATLLMDSSPCSQYLCGVCRLRSYWISRWRTCLLFKLISSFFLNLYLRL